MTALVDHLNRTSEPVKASKGVAVKPRDLYSEAEKILAKASGGMSLFERISRDAELRNDLLTLLRELDAAHQPSPLQGKPDPNPTSSSRKKARPTADAGHDADMRDVVIQDIDRQEGDPPNMLLRLASPLEDRWNDD